MDEPVILSDVLSFQATEGRAYIFGLRGKTTARRPEQDDLPLPGAGHLLAGVTNIALASPSARTAIEFARRTRAGVRCSIYDIVEGTPTRAFRKDLSEPPAEEASVSSYGGAPPAPETLLGLSRYNPSSAAWSPTRAANNRAIMTHMVRTETSDSTIFGYLGFLDSVGERNWLPNEALDVLQSAIVPGRETFVPVSLAFLRSIGRGIVTSDTAWRLWKEAAFCDFRSATGIEAGGNLNDVSIEGGGWSSESLHQLVGVLRHIYDLPETDLARVVVPILLRCYLNHSRIVRLVLVDRPAPVGLDYVLKGILGTQEHPRARSVQASFKLENTGKIFVVSGDAGDTRMLEKTGYVEWSSSVPGTFQIIVAGMSSAENSLPRLLVNGKPFEIASAPIDLPTDLPLEIVRLWDRIQTLKMSLEDEKRSAREAATASEGKKKSEREERLDACVRDRSIEYGFLVRDGIDLWSAALTAVSRGSMAQAESESARSKAEDDDSVRTLKWFSDFCHITLPRRLTAQLTSGSPLWPTLASKRVRISTPSVLRAASGPGY